MKFGKLFRTFCNAVAFVEVRRKNGTVAGGTAYHVGDGVFLTAKHVVENNEIVSVQTTTRGYESSSGHVKLSGKRFRVAKKVNNYDRQSGKVILGPFFSGYYDLAIFVVDGIDAPTIELSFDSYDPYFVDEDVTLSKVLVLGYPPVAFSDGPRLVAATAEVNTVIDKYTGGAPHFIVSTMARGGFSGGPCLNKNGQSLGIITESLTLDNKEPETGFLAVLTVKPIVFLMVENNLVPTAQEKIVDLVVFNWRRPDPQGKNFRDSDWVKARNEEAAAATKRRQEEEKTRAS
jgi:V8-like Glu-specific endopeptidase